MTMQKRACLPLLVMLAGTTAPSAQDAVPLPRLDWKPIVYSNPVAAVPDDRAIADLWTDEIAANDQAYRASGDGRYQGGHAPATEAHFVVRSPEKIVVLSMLNTAFGCRDQQSDPEAHVTVRMCPLKIAVYEGSIRSVTAGAKGCVLQATDLSADPRVSSTAAAYDVRTRSIRIGTLLDHTPVAGCSNNIPIYDHLTP